MEIGEDMRSSAAFLFCSLLVAATPVGAQVLRERTRMCQALVLNMLEGSAIAAAAADACNDLKLKVEQARLAINIAIAVGVDESVAIEVFTREYVTVSKSGRKCDLDGMIALGNSFQDTAEQTMDFCSVIAP
ncbi:MAG: hypothetical protein QM744_19565 [Mesorhizobium sp.]